MPALASLAAFAQAVADFPASDPGLVLEPAARAAAERSVRESGFLLLGEVHAAGSPPATWPCSGSAPPGRWSSP
ncbi:MAG: hypothetical protein JWL68_5276 [Actinomycetia bacterium]|nr:hypothetical protein [Actinomycetes bacterium]